MSPNFCHPNGTFAKCGFDSIPNSLLGDAVTTGMGGRGASPIGIGGSGRSRSGIRLRAENTSFS